MTGRKPRRTPSTPSDQEARKPSRTARVLAAVISPLVFLGVLDLVLRLVGVGIPSSFYVAWPGEGEEVDITNPRYCEHFVPKARARAPIFSALPPKAPKEYRIFVLGGSAANGDPEPAFGFCRQLEVLLNAHASEATFRVINAAVVSMNSHVARRIAEDCAEHQPDLFVVFMGNNEVVGPYGPPTLPAPVYQHRGLIDLSIAARRQTRLGQLMAQAASSLRDGGPIEGEWLGMEAFLEHEIPADDPEMASCYQHFQRNLEDIVETARGCGAQVVLCRPPINLQDCPPFASRHAPGLTAEQLAQWEQHWEQGRVLEQEGRWEEAGEAYRQAAEIDDRYAALRFGQARCAAELGQVERAQAEYGAARDLDALRFRADREIARRVEETATANGVSYLDLASLLAARCEDGLLGSEFMVDHVHLHFEGNFVAAWHALEAIRGLAGAGTLAASDRPPEAWLGEVKQRLLYDDEEAYKVALNMYRRKTRPPFTDQLHHQQEMAALRQDLFARKQQANEHPADEDTLRTALERRPDDAALQTRYGRWLLGRGRVDEAIAFYQGILEAAPYDQEIQLELAYAYAHRDPFEAIGSLTAGGGARRYDPVAAHNSIGTYYVKAGRIEEAQRVYKALSDLAPDLPEAWLNLASAASNRGDLPAMKRFVDRALELSPDMIQARIALGNYWAKRDQPENARACFAEAVEMDPHSFLAHIGLGMQTLRIGQTREGVDHIERALELNPEAVAGYGILASVYEAAGYPEIAARYAAWRDLFSPSPVKEAPVP